MKIDRDNVLRVLKTNLPAIIVIVIMTIALKIALDYIMILSFIILYICYVVLGIVVELVMDKFFPITKETSKQKVNLNKEIYQNVNNPRIVDMTKKATKEAPTKINTAPYASQAAERLRKTKINFEDYMSENDETTKKDNPYFSSQKTHFHEEKTEKLSGVTVINDYSSLLKKARLNEEKPIVKEEVKPVVKEEKTENQSQPKNQEAASENEKDSIKDILFGSKKDIYDDFSVKSSSDLDRESNSIKNEVDKRLFDTNHTSLPYRKKKQAPPDNLIININKDIKEVDNKNEITDDIPEDFVLKAEINKLYEDLDEISFDVITSDEEEEEENDKAIADSDLISELYKESANKKKQPFWKSLFK